MVGEPVRTLFVTGGTHGNESTGVELARYLQRHPELYSHYSFKTTVLITNEAAVEKNTRYVEEDMNRCFFLKDLADASKSSLEAKRAKDLNAIIGPKGSASPAADLVIDLHNTTAATGACMMMAPGDELSHAMAAHLAAVDPRCRVCNWNAGQKDDPMLTSVGRAGFTFEVGPVPWGCVDGALYQQSLRLLMACFEYVEAHNAACRGERAWGEGTVEVHSLVRAVDYPRDAGGMLAGLIHPSLQNQDFVAPLRRGDTAFLSLDGETAIKYNPKRSADEVHAGEEEEEAVYPFFVNEAAYYEKGIAFMLARRTTRSVRVAAGLAE
jgi:succinylglutamate desuccinylase